MMEKEFGYEQIGCPESSSSTKDGDPIFGIAPRVRGDLFAVVFREGKFYLCKEDDMHWHEKTEIDLEVIPGIIEDLKKLKGVIQVDSDGNHNIKRMYLDTQRLIMSRRDGQGDLIYLAVNNTIISFDAFWIDDLLGVLEKFI